jgi:hypothetical protein
LFKHNVQLYIYPYHDTASNTLCKVENLHVDPSQRHLYEYLKHSDVIKQIEEFNEAYLHIFSPDVLQMIIDNKAGWENLVPEVVAEKIKAQRLFGYRE